MSEEEGLEVQEVSPDRLYVGNNTTCNNNNIEFDFVDHFSLKQSSSSVRVRGVTTRIYQLANDQLQLQTSITSTNNNSTGSKKVKIQMQRLRGNNLGLCVLRSIYTLVALLMAGFTFVLTCNIIVMQAMEIPRHADASSSSVAAGAKANIPLVLANFLSLPLLLYSMASIMILACIFVADAWNGHVLFSLLLMPTSTLLFTEKDSSIIMERRQVYVEWYCFIIYLGIPLLAYIVAALTGNDNWAEIGGITWYISMAASFVIFCAVVVYQEIKLCLDLTKIQQQQHSNNQIQAPLSLSSVIQQAVLTTLTQRYAGRQERQYLVHEQQNTTDPKASVASNPNMQPKKTTRSIYSRFTTTTICSNYFFDKVEPPQRHYSIHELRETVPIVTNHTWHLTKMCCEMGRKTRQSRYAVQGPNALNPYQFKSTLICNILAVYLGLLFLAAILYALGQGTIAIIVAVLLGGLLLGIPCLVASTQIYRAMLPTTTTQQDDNNNSDDDDEGDTPILYQAWSSFTVSKPKPWYCWLRFVIEVAFFFLWPMLTFFVEGLPKIAALFLVTSIFSLARLNLDAASIISEQYSISNINFSNDENDNDDNNDKSDAGAKAKDMLARARASEVMGKITNSSRIFFWIAVYFLMAAFFIYSSLTSVDSGEDFNTQTGREPIRFLNDFYYPRRNDSMLYPNCQLTNQYAIPGLQNTYGLDYNLLAALGYETSNVTGYILNKWFGGETESVIEETDLVNQWRQDTGNSLQQVSFKLFSFPSQPGVGILSIRGTETPMDRLFNSQLYLGSVLTQVVRAAMPFSWLWDSIYDDLLTTTTWVASEQLLESEYYRITTAFANDLLLNNYTGVDGKTFQWLRTTGVSLGGGLALITGAQTGAWAYAFSGPNPTLGRKSFSPPITTQQLKERVINIKPDNDFVSSIGDLVPNYQLVRCRTWPAKVQNCHSFWRIFCEYLYTCGSPVDRPGAMCICVERWGYPEPIRRSGNLTFQEACAAEEDNLVAELGDIFGEAE